MKRKHLISRQLVNTLVSVFLNKTLSIYYVAYAISIVICFMSIFRYVLPGNHLLLSIKISCILCSIAYEIGNTAWFININCSLCHWCMDNSFNEKGHMFSSIIICCNIFHGNNVFFISTIILDAFGQCIWWVNVWNINWNQTIVTIFLSILLSSYLMVLMMTVVFYILNQIYLYLYGFSLLLISINMIGYITASTLLVRLMFSKIRNFTVFFDNIRGNQELVAKTT